MQHDTPSDEFRAEARNHIHLHAALRSYESERAAIGDRARPWAYHLEKAALAQARCIAMQIAREVEELNRRPPHTYIPAPQQ